jgi:hypothetical protein
MSDDSFTEITSENWLSRMGGALKGIFLGLLLFIAAFPLLWWNEGRSVERYNSLNEGLAQVISVSSETLDKSNNDKLIHTQGLAKTTDVLTDDVFKISVTAIQLTRHVSMYQWAEHQQSETIEKIGGTQETRTTYSYRKEWRIHAIDSTRFKRSGHNNPAFLFSPKTWMAKKVTLGVFTLNSSQISRINATQNFNLQAVNAPNVVANKPLAIKGNVFYLGTAENDPAIGDMKIHFEIVNPTEISLVTQQKGNRFRPYETKAGSPIDLLKVGTMDATAMFAAAQQENTFITWALRLAGLFLMWMGLSMIFQPLATLASVVPFIGNFLSIGTKILAFLLSLPCALITIAVAWIAYRPLLAGSLIAVAVLSLVVVKWMSSKKPPERAATSTS